jgi:hypothetical protein
MTKRSLLLAAGALVLTSTMTSAQNEPSQDTIKLPAGVESTTNTPCSDRPPGSDRRGGRASQETGQAPNVSKKMGSEMDSAGDQRASPDEQ